MAKQLGNVRHDYIRYANCWEDADLLLKGLSIEPGDRVLSIASAGDNSLSLLCHDPELVVAVDINTAQLKLLKLKIAAFKILDHHEVLSFLGFQEHSDRMKLYAKLRGHLPQEDQEYWDQRSEEIIQGLIHAGKFERYFQLFRKKVLPLIHGSKRIAELFRSKTPEEQKHFCENTWFNRRWIFLFKIFFSRFVLGTFGRDPKFLNEVKVAVSTFILESARIHLGSTYCQNNYFLQYILLGSFETQLPHYARSENFEKIKANLDRIEVFHGLAEDAFQRYDGFNKFNLSNIFEYMDLDLFKSVSQNFLENSAPSARFAYWNLMVDRKMERLENDLQADPNYGLRMAEDCGFFYKDFNVSVRNG